MAKKSASKPAPETKEKPAKKEKKPKDGALRGLRRAEAVNRQIERWKEKFDMEDNAAEWLKFANAVIASMEVLYAQALLRVNPLKMKRPRAEPTAETTEG